METVSQRFHSYLTNEVHYLAALSAKNKKYTFLQVYV